jgi:hypothetical protein
MPLREITICNYEYSGRSLTFGGRLRINLSTQGESKSRRDELEEHGETLFRAIRAKVLGLIRPLLIRLKRVQDEMHSDLGAVAPPPAYLNTVAEPHKLVSINWPYDEISKNITNEVFGVRQGI